MNSYDNKSSKIKISSLIILSLGILCYSQGLYSIKKDGSDKQGDSAQKAIVEALSSKAKGAGKDLFSSVVSDIDIELPFFGGIALKGEKEDNSVKYTGSIGGKIQAGPVTVDSGEIILTKESLDFSAEAKIFNVSAKLNINDLKVKGGKITHVSGDIEGSKGDVLDLPNLTLTKVGFSADSEDKEFSISGIHKMKGLDLQVDLAATAGQEEKTFDASISVESKDFQPLKKASKIPKALQDLTINDLSVSGDASYSSKSGLSGQLQIIGSVTLGEVFGKDENAIQKSKALQMELQSAIKLDLEKGQRPGLILDISVDNVPTLGELFPDLFSNLPKEKEMHQTITKGKNKGKTEKKRLKKHDSSAKDALSIIDLFRIKAGHIVVSTEDGAEFNNKKYKRGLSLDAEIELNLSNQDNTIVKFLKPIVSSTNEHKGGDAASLSVTGNINPENFRETSLKIAVGSGDLKAKVPNTGIEFKDFHVGLEISGEPALAAEIGFTMIPSKGAEPLEFSSAVEFNMFAVGFRTTMVNVWTEPFGVKGFAFGNLGAQWFQTYAEITAALAASTTGVGAVTWIEVIFAPQEVGLSGEFTFVRSQAQSRLRRAYKSDVDKDFKSKLQQEEYKGLSKKEKDQLKKTLMNQRIFDHKCGQLHTTEKKVTKDDDYACARVFLNIGKDFTNFGIDVAFENPLNLPALIDFVGQQAKANTDKLESAVDKIVPLKVKQATLKFVPVGSSIGNITVDSGLGLSGIINILGKDACFVADLDFVKGILLKGKIPKFNLGPVFSISGAHCKADKQYRIACTADEARKLERYSKSHTSSKDRNPDTCEKADPGFELNINWDAPPKFVVTGHASIFKNVLEGKVKLYISKDKIEGNFTSHIFGDTEAKVRFFTEENEDPSSFNFEDLGIEILLDNNLPQSLNKVIKELEKKVHKKIEEILNKAEKELQKKKKSVGACQELEMLKKHR